MFRIGICNWNHSNTKVMHHLHIIAAYIFSHKAKTQYIHMEKQTQIWKPFLWRISFWETTLAIRYALSHRCMLKESLPIYLNAIWMNHQLSITSDLQKVLKNCYFIPLHYLNDAFYRDEAFYRFTCLNSLAGCLAKASHMCSVLNPTSSKPQIFWCFKNIVLQNVQKERVLKVFRFFSHILIEGCLHLL